MNYGANARKIIDAAREKGTPVPKSIIEAPIPEDEYQIRVFSAFERLSTCRQVVMGAVGPIPWSAIDHYAQRMGIVDDEIAYEDFVAIVQELDETFLAKRGKEIEQERKKAANGNPGQVRRPHPRSRRRR